MPFLWLLPLLVGLYSSLNALCMPNCFWFLDLPKPRVQSQEIARPAMIWNVCCDGVTPVCNGNTIMDANANLLDVYAPKFPSLSHCLWPSCKAILSACSDANFLGSNILQHLILIWDTAFKFHPLIWTLATNSGKRHLGTFVSAEQLMVVSHVSCRLFHKFSPRLFII